MELQIPGNPQLCILEPGSSGSVFPGSEFCYTSRICNIYTYKARGPGKAKKSIP